MRIYGEIRVAVLVLILAQASAFAESAALQNYTKDGTPSWMENPAYMECGLKCIYLQSVEKLSVRSRHTLETLNQMKAAKSEPDMDAIIPGMCDWAGGEKVNECQIRWFKVQLPTLYQDRMAIKFNTSSAAEMESGQVPAIVTNGVATVDPSRPIVAAKPQLFLNSVPSDYDPKSPIVTTMEQYGTIRERAILNSGRDPRLTQISVLSEQIRLSLGVDRNEFVVTKPVLKDPSDPKAGTYAVVQTNSKGIVIDEVAYRKEVLYRMNLLKLEPEEERRIKANLQNLGDLHRRQLTKPDSDAKHKNIYTKVRTSILGAAKRGLEKLKIIAPKGAPPRAPATVPGVKPNPQALTRAVTGPAGASTENVRENDERTGDDDDIRVPPSTPAGSRPYVTVGYSDNVLGNEINNIEQDLKDLRNVDFQR